MVLLTKGNLDIVLLKKGNSLQNFEFYNKPRFARHHIFLIGKKATAPSFFDGEYLGTTKF